MAEPAADRRHAARPGALFSLPAVLFARWLDWTARYSQRRALAALDARMLRDVGLTRSDVERETAKPMWQP